MSEYGFELQVRQTAMNEYGVELQEPQELIAQL
jgi:hypothetical protein